jgi:hypothetical protein
MGVLSVVVEVEDSKKLSAKTTKAAGFCEPGGLEEVR